MGFSGHTRRLSHQNGNLLDRVHYHCPESHEQGCPCRVQVTKTSWRFAASTASAIACHRCGQARAARRPFTLTEVRVLYELAHAADSPDHSGDGLTAAAIGQNARPRPELPRSRILRKFDAQGLIARAASSSESPRRAHHTDRCGSASVGSFRIRQQRRDGGAAGKPSRAPDRSNSVRRHAWQIESTLAPQRTWPATPATGERFPVARPPTRRHGLGDQPSRRALPPGIWLGRHFEAMVADICAKFIRDFDPTGERCWIAEDDDGPLGSIFLCCVTTPPRAKLRMLLVVSRARGGPPCQRLVDECPRSRAKRDTARDAVDQRHPFTRRAI